MPAFSRARILIVARQTANSVELCQAVASRASDRACTFTLMVPAAPRRLRLVNGSGQPGDRDAERRLSLALPLLSAAAGGEVVGIVGAHEPFRAVEDALKLLGFDEVIISMLRPGISGWQRDGLPEKIRALGVAVTEVVCTHSPLEPLPAA